MPEISALWFLVKILFLLTLAIYVVFASVVVRQIYLMTTTLSLGYDLFVRLIGWLHLFIALGILFLAFLIL